MATELEIRTRLAEQRRALEDLQRGPFVVVGYHNASPAHLELLEHYVQALTAAKAEADEWWQALLDTATRRIGDARAARANVEMGAPAGRVAHGNVTHVFRDAWMGCVAINSGVSGAPQIEPFELTFDWLLLHRHFALLEFVGSFPFLPIGVDASGAWV